MDICVSNEQFVAPSSQKSEFSRVFSFKFYYVKADILEPRVAKEKEFFILLIKDSCFDDSNSIKLIHINLFLGLYIYPETVSLIGHQHQSLSVVHVEEIRLQKQSSSVFVDYIYLFILIVELKDAISFSEYQRVWLFIDFIFFEEKLHRHFVKNLDIFDQYPFMQDIIVIFFETFLFKNEELILLLLFHDQILSTDYS